MLEKFLLWSSKSYSRPRLLAAIAVAATLLFALFLPGLRFDNDIKHMIPQDHPDIVVNNYYEDDARFGSSFLALVGVESDDAYSARSLRYLKELQDGIGEMNRELPRRNLSRLLGLGSEDIEALIRMIDEAGVNRNSFRAEAYPWLSRSAELVSRFSLETAQASRIAGAVAKADPAKLYDQYLRPVEKVQSLVNADYISGTPDELVVEKLVDENRLDDGAAAEARRRIESWPLYRGALVSEDGRLATIVLTLSNTDADVSLAVDAGLRDLLKAKARAGFTTYVDGEPIITTRMSQAMRSDILILLPLVLVVVVAILWACFRNVGGVVYPILVVLISVVWGLGIQVLAGVPLTIMGIAMPVLLVAIASAYGIHQMNHYLLDPEEEKAKILSRNMKSVGLAITLSGLTVMIGFGALALEQFVPVRNFGIYTAIGDLVAVGAALYFLPAFILLSRKPKTAVVRESGHGWIGRILTGLVTVNRKAPAVAVIVAAAVTVIFGLGSLRVKSDMNVVAFFRRTEPIRIADEKLNDKLSGTEQLAIILDSDLTPVIDRAKGAPEGETVDLATPDVLRKIDAFSTAVQARFPIVRKTISFNDILKKVNQVMTGGGPEAYAIPDSPELISQYLLVFSGDTKNVMTANHDKLQLTLTMKRSSTAETEKVRQFAEEFFDPAFLAQHHAQLQVTGVSHLYHVGDQLLVEGTYRAIAACVVVVFLLLLYVLRSFWMSLIAMLPIVLTLAINFGVLGFFGIPFNAGTAMVSSIAIGIGVDYSIHYITWYRNELRANADIIPALEAAIVRKGRAILYNMFVIAGGFLVLMVSRFVPLIQFGAIVALCMLTTAFGALIVVPAVIRLLAGKDRAFLHLGVANDRWARPTRRRRG
jgi:predicted RND superfamily exporter protein